MKSRWMAAAVAAGLALALLALGGAWAGGLARPAGGVPNVIATLVVAGLNRPVDIAHTGLPGDDRLFIVERQGRIVIVRDGAIAPTAFLDITGQVDSDYTEEGLLGLAFHPDFATNGQFFVYYNVKGSDYIRLSRFEVDESNPDVADPTETPILEIFHPCNPNHNGGDLNFDLEGYLYLAPGDGGGQDDMDAGCPGYDNENDAQRLDSLLGKVLRINVTDVPTYTIPDTNPFTTTEGARGEIWLYGLRNPWRFSFDRLTGDLYVGDVGQGLREEVNFYAADAPGGQNFGWRCFEGTWAHNYSGCGPADDYLSPFFEYSHDEGIAVTGGYVYRGSSYPGLYGLYFFADHYSGQFWVTDTDTWDTSPLALHVTSVSAFGEDVAGELYFVTHKAEGELYRLEENTFVHRMYVPFVKN